MGCSAPPLPSCSRESSPSSAIGCQHPAEIPGKWWVASVAGAKGVFHSDAKYADSLARSGIPHYIPREKITRIRNNARQVVERPVFAGYVFLAVQNDYELFEAKYVNPLLHPQMIRVADQAGLVRDLSPLFETQMNGELVPAYRDFQPGRKVEVIAGPLRGHQAFIDSRDAKKCQVTLKVAILGQSVAVQISPELLELA